MTNLVPLKHCAHHTGYFHACTDR